MGLKINLSNKVAYTFIAFGIIILLGIGINALVPGQTPNPGHNIQNIGPPTPCVAGYYLQFNGTDWICAEGPQAIPSGGADNDWAIVGSNQYSNVTGNVGIGTSTPSSKLDVVGDIKFSGVIKSASGDFVIQLG